MNQPDFDQSPSSGADKSLAQLETLSGYRRYFMDLATWQPYVRRVARRHRLPAESIRPGLAGTYPTFIVDDQWVVKFFGRLFEGGTTIAIEAAVNRLVTADSFIPAPALLAGGQLFADPAKVGWLWPYLIFEFVPGTSIGAVYEQLSVADRLAVSGELGRLTRRLHTLPLPTSGPLANGANTYRTLLQQQRARCVDQHRAWGTLPGRMLAQLDDFMPPLNTLLAWAGPLHLIHADLTADHLLGQLVDGRWQTLALIDFGDAMVAELGYELVALHLDLFRCDKRLLAAYLDAYALSSESRRLLPRWAMAMTLLHRFDVLAGIFQAYPQAGQVESLADLAGWLWNIEEPGLVA